MAAEDVQIVKQELTPEFFESDDPAFFLERDDLIDLDEEEVDPHTEELNRLNAELADCRRRQRAFEAYLAGLGNGITTD
jgi:hypothetical protein